MSDSRYLTPAQAARELGWEGEDADIAKRFRRVVLTKERRHRREIFLRRGSSGAGVRYLITRPLMRKWLAELFDPESRIVADLRKVLQELNRKIDVEAGKREALLEANERLAERVMRLESYLPRSANSTRGSTE